MGWLRIEINLNRLTPNPRRWTVIASGLLCGVLALVVLFTSPGAFFSPLAVVVMGAVGLVAVLLQVRLLQHQGQTQSSRSLAWLNGLGAVFALAAFVTDLFRLNPQLTEALALGAVGSFGVSGVIILRGFRKRATSK
jgi:O-antigen/teichoic acid export membrane protein